MVAKPPPLQDLFFQRLITEKLPVTVFLVNGLKLQGTITEIDNFSMIIVRGSTQLLIYKHVVATILPDAPLNLWNKREAQ
jgi:host factor-I protein